VVTVELTEFWNVSDLCVSELTDTKIERDQLGFTCETIEEVHGRLLHDGQPVGRAGLFVAQAS
jgi:hypothetical protein